MKVHVTGGDYEYDGVLCVVFRKSTGAVRYVVEDANKRLFIHNAKQLGKEEGWWPMLPPQLPLQEPDTMFERYDPECIPGN